MSSRNCYCMQTMTLHTPFVIWRPQATFYYSSGISDYANVGRTHLLWFTNTTYVQNNLVTSSKERLSLPKWNKLRAVVYKLAYGNGLAFLLSQRVLLKNIFLSVLFAVLKLSQTKISINFRRFDLPLLQVERGKKNRIWWTF